MGISNGHRLTPRFVACWIFSSQDALTTTEVTSTAAMDCKAPSKLQSDGKNLTIHLVVDGF